VLNRKRVARKLAGRLRQLRKSKGLSQEDLAYESGLGRSYYWRVEQGLINVTLETLVKLCNALKVEIVDLFQK
jgi:transcriptional regulator with XRE-family HTH domain